MKKTIKIFGILLLLVSFGIWMFVRTLYPSYNGELELKNLSDKVTVIYDENGVPHIEAQNQNDAYTALGYVHAQDRLWQMELMRRIMAGRLSEILGKDLIEVDKFMGSLGVNENSIKASANFDTSSKHYKLTQAYLNGINQFIDKGATPLEFHLLGIEKEHYTVKDVFNVFGYMGFSFAAAFKEDPLMTEIHDKFGAAYVNEFTNTPNHTTIIKRSNKKIQADFAKNVNKIIEKLPAPLIEGSNSWVLGKSRTKNGKVILANDPHIGYSQPSVWYQSHIKTPDYEMYGFNIALTPFQLLGHNRNYAYGITMFENDDIDFYVEENNPDNLSEYKTESGYEPYKIIEKTIKVKDGDDVKHKVKVSRHGPILNDVLSLTDKRPIAMKWIYTNIKNNSIETCYEISHSNSFEDFTKKAYLLGAPGLNIMYGDNKNNIAMLGVAKLYKYKENINRKLFLDGASGKNEIVEFINPDENLKSINPKTGYVYSANNQHDTISGILYPGYYLAEDRAKRITELIDPKHNFTKEDVMSMALDVKSSVVESIIDDAFKVIENSDLTEKELEITENLKEWDGSFKKEKIAPTIYTRFIYEFMKNTFADEMGKGFKQFLELSLENKMRAEQMSKVESVWWDNINTKDKKETKKYIVTDSYKKAIKFLENQLGADYKTWSWDKVFSVEHPHSLEKGGELLRSLFNVGPFKTDGGKGVINNLSFQLNETGYYVAKSGPSTRRVVDFSDVENSVAIVPTGQSGNRFSEFYKDQSEKYLKGEYVKMMINKNDYKDSKNILYLLPLK